MNSSEKPRALTPYETTVVAGLLGASEEREERRIHASGLPRSTYQDAKLRLYSQGIIEDRYVPSPAALGFSRVGFILSRPFAEDRDREVDELERQPTTVLLWSMANSLFAVSYGNSPSIEAAGTESTRFTLNVDPATPSVPVYFDFEGAFDHLAGIDGSKRYPRPLPSGGSGENGLGTEKIAAIVRRPFEGVGTKGRMYPIRPASLPRSERHLLAQGQVDWRVFPNLAALPAFQGVHFSHVLFFHGMLRDETSLDKIFHELVEECVVFPFLLASDGSQVLIGGLSASIDQSAKQPRVPPFPRESVVAALGRHLQKISIIREEIAHLNVRLSHRYDRLATR